MVNAPGCATFAKFLAFALLGGMALAVAFFAQHSVSGLTGPQPSAPRATVTPTISQDVPAVSDRHFGSGSTHAVVSGDLTFDVTLPIDKDQAYAQDGLAWIAFGSPGDPRAVLVSLDEPANSVAISRNGETALGVDDQCNFEITVTAADVSGHISCPFADALRGGVKFGEVSIEVDFSAGS